MKTPMAPQLLSSDHMKKILFGSLMSLALTACTTEKTTKVMMPSPGQNSLGTTTVRESSDGTVNGGGGKGVMCNKNGKTTVELLDLYEARILYGLDLIAFNETGEAARLKVADMIGEKLHGNNEVFDDEFRMMNRENFKEFYQAIRFIEGEKELKQTNDSLEALIEKDCSSVQIATFYDETILLINKSLWAKMDAKNQAALLAHEYLYFLDRYVGNSNSARARKFVGHLFSTKSVKSKFEPKGSRRSLSCGMEDNSGKYLGTIIAYEVLNPSDEEKLELMFYSLPKLGILFRMSALFYQPTLDDLKNPTTEFGTEFANINYDTYPYSPVMLGLRSVGIGNWESPSIYKLELDVIESGTNHTIATYKLSCDEGPSPEVEYGESHEISITEGKTPKRPEVKKVTIQAD